MQEAARLLREQTGIAAACVTAAEQIWITNSYFVREGNTVTLYIWISNLFRAGRSDVRKMTMMRYIWISNALFSTGQCDEREKN